MKCPDEGTCHHSCSKDYCWRKENCGALSGSKFNPDWTLKMSRYEDLRKIVIEIGDITDHWLNDHDDPAEVISDIICLFGSAPLAGHVAGTIEEEPEDIHQCLDCLQNFDTDMDLKVHAKYCPGIRV